MAWRRTSKSFFPSLLERRRRVDQALFAVVMEAYLHGVSTRKVDDLVRALGVDSGVSKSEVSRICAELDAEVAAFRSRSLVHTAMPYLSVDATYCKARVKRRVVSQSSGRGDRGMSWRPPRGPRLRGRRLRGWGLLDPIPTVAEGPRAAGVQLVIADAHLGLPSRERGRGRRGGPALPGAFPQNRAG
jgi:putative transposase